MNAPVAQATIFLPLIVLVTLTLVGLLRLGVLRVRAGKHRQVRFSYYRAFQGEPEPEQVAAAARHYNNLFEAPVLFYVGSVVVFELGAVTPWMLFIAWGYVVARLVQSAVHLTTNNVRHRALAFLAGWAFLVALWIRIGAAVAAQI